MKRQFRIQFDFQLKTNPTGTQLIIWRIQAPLGWSPTPPPRSP